MLSFESWHEEAITLAAFLKRAAGDRAMPGRRDLRPEQLPPSLLSSLFMVDVEATPTGDISPWRYRFRLIGEELVAMTGANWTGLFLDGDLVGNRLPTFLAAFDTVMRTRQPSRSQHDFLNLRSNIAYPSVRYLFPLSSDGQTIDVLLGYIVALSREWIDEPVAPQFLSPKA
jgi:hypothetical protein